MAMSTYLTFLMKGTVSSSTITYADLAPIKSYPDLGGTPEMIDVTDLVHKFRQYIEGVQDTGALEFTLNYDPTVYQTLKALSGSQHYAVWFGGTVSGGTITPTGSDGQFAFEGELSVYVNGGEVNGAREMTVSIAPNSDIAFSVPA